jgi:hypothetical protein
MRSVHLIVSILVVEAAIWRRVTSATALAALLALAVAAPASGKPGDLYALRYGAHGNVVRPYDAVTFRPSGPAIALGRFGHAWSVSADRRWLVAGAGVRRAGEPTAVRFVDLRADAVGATTILAGERGRVAATAWVQGRVLVAVAGSRSTTVYAVDPTTRRVVGTVEVDGVLVSGERTAARLVLLLAPLDAIGPATLAVVDRAPRARTVVLERITAGTVATGEGSERRLTLQRPGMAVSPSGLRLHVFGGGEPAAAVDLRTLSVRYAPLRRPAAMRKSARGSVRTAAALPDGRIVVSGYDHGSTKPVGVSLVDPRDWSTRVLVPAATWVRVAGGLIFTRGKAGVGLRLLEPSGRGHDLLHNGSPATVNVVGPHALVTFFGSGRRGAVVHLPTRRVVGLTAPAHLLLGAGQPITG